MDRLRINLFGELWKLSRLDLPVTEYAILESRASELKMPLYEALLDFHFFESDLFPNDFTYLDLKYKKISGLLNTYKNQVEIWHVGRKAKKISIRDLDDHHLLSLGYKSKTARLNYNDLVKGIYIEQEEIGLVSRYETVAECFELSDLEFNITEVNKDGRCFDILTGVSLSDNNLIEIENFESLITSMFCFEV